MKNNKMTKFSLVNLIIFTILISISLYSQDNTDDQKSFADFKLNDQYTDKKSTVQVALEDLDNDGDLDAVCSNMGYNNSQVLFNDGKGNFTDSGQELTQQGHGVGVDDLNGDGTPDIFITCAGYKTGNEKKYNNKPSKIYFNNGKGQFQDSGQILGDKDLSGNAVQLLDADLDGDIDVVVEYNQNPDILYINNGKGYFTKSDIMIPENPLFLDIDADGDMDIFCRQFGRGFKILMNYEGRFREYWTMIDTMIVNGAASFGDFDNDKDLDIVFTNGNRNYNSPSKVLLNDGNGMFKDSGQKLSRSIFGRVCVGDLNGDKTLDLLITNLGEASVVWSNDGKGNFTITNSIIGTLSPFQRPVIKDLDKDGYNDVFIANFDGGSNQYSNEIWLNQKKSNDTR
ncbi:MAG: VCBS repeat-containing protein [Candidatus Tenebribacter davisii]|nr:VCBS repeat-containing protein [Candidatus Tenebribacter davisii]